MSACDDCLRRADLVAALAGWLDIEWRKRGAPSRVLALPDEVLLASSGDPRVRHRYDGFDTDADGGNFSAARPPWRVWLSIRA